jgi:hypothetical protein
MESRRQADLLFGRLTLPGYKREEKREFFASLIHFAKQAIYRRGCIMYPRGDHEPSSSRVRRQVIDAAVTAGLFREERSPPGSPKMSRLLPLPPLVEIADVDPWTFDPSGEQQLVFLRKRGRKKEELSFDSDLRVPAIYTHRLSNINAVNARCNITYEPYDEWEDCHRGERWLRPVHYAIFTDDFDHHGRIYTGNYGHQSLRKLERQTIRFDGQPTVELDYAGLHTRMLYHLDGVDFKGDPYALWGKNWGGRPQLRQPLRMMAKTVVNAAINAKDRRSAVSACNDKMKMRTADGTWKEGKALRTARRFNDAVRETGLRFAMVYDLALRFHKSIANQFGSDMGLQLMNIDGRIALDILFHFSSSHIPCLACRDSFIVPSVHEGQLRRAMAYYYRIRLNKNPHIT